MGGGLKSRPRSPPARRGIYRSVVAVSPSPEIESVLRRVFSAWQAGDMATISNAFAGDASLRGIGSDADEWRVGGDEFLGVRGTQFDEMPEYDLEIHDVAAFQDGPIGWAAARMTMVTPVTRTPLRTTAVLRIEAGTWRIIQWHNSIPVANEQIFGVELTTTLDQLLASVLEEGAAIRLLNSSEGTMTLMFTDIVDSTVLVEAAGDRAWAETVSQHESTIRRIAELHGGTVVKMLGDGSMLAFDSARAAVRAAVEIQRAFVGEAFAVRIGIHTGEVVRTVDDVLGLTVNKAARIAASADGGDIMVSSTVKDLVGSTQGVRFGQPMLVALKGLSDTHQIVPLQRDQV